MKKIILLISGLLILLLNACVYSVRDTLYLSNADVKAPVSSPQLNIDMLPFRGISFKVSPEISINNSEPISATTENKYNPAILSNGPNVPTNYRNLSWKSNSITLGGTMDVRLTKDFSWFAGIRYNNIDTKELIGGSIGLGLIMSSSVISSRIDVGLTFQEYYYNATTILLRETDDWFGKVTHETYVFQDMDKKLNSNPFISLTLNTMNKKSILNYFISLGYFTQNLLNFSPKHESKLFSNGAYSYTMTDERPDCTTGFIFLSPGIACRLTDKVNLLFYTKILTECQLNNPSKSLIILPGIKLDYNL